MLNWTIGKQSFEEAISPFVVERYNDKIVKMLMIILKYREIDPKFIKDNYDDFGLKPNMVQKFYEEAIKFYEQKKNGQDQSNQNMLDQNEEFGIRNKLNILIKAIFQRFGKDPDETNIVDDILDDRSMDKMLIELPLTRPIFNKFRRILQKCCSYQAWKNYDGVDIKLAKNQMKKDILSVLNDDLKLKDSLQQLISQQLLQNPLSSIVSNHNDLTNNQIKLFHESKLYQKNILRKYANIVLFKQTKLCKAREQISEIVDLIQKKNIRIFNQIIDSLRTYRHLDLLKLIQQQHQKSIYEFIKQKKCFYDICLKVADIKNTDEEQKDKFITSLSENMRANQILELRIKFLKLRLPFEQWKQAQFQFFDLNYDRTLSREKRSYSYISQLSLNSLRRIILLSQLFSSIEAIFRSIQYPISYRNRIQQKLFDIILCDDKVFEIRLHKIKSLIIQTMQSRHEQFASQANDLRSKQRMVYNERILKDQDLVKYKQNHGRDIDDEKYKRKNQIRQIIYSTNQEMEIDWSYKQIEAFIEDVVENNVTTIEFIDNYKRKLARQLQMPGAIVEQAIMDNVQQERKSLEEYVSMFNLLSSQIIVPRYIASNEQSKFQKVLVEVYGNDKPKIIREIITSKAYEDENSEFYIKLPYNNIIKKKISKEIVRVFSLFLTQQIQQAKGIMAKIIELQENRQNGQNSMGNQQNMADLEENFRAESKKFLEDYFNQFENSMLQNIYKNRYDENAPNLVRDIVNQKAFSDPQFNFVNSLDFNRILKERCKREFSQISAYFEQKILRCRMILANMR